MKKISLAKSIAATGIAVLMLFNPAQTKAQDDIIDKSSTLSLEGGACSNGNYTIDFAFPYYPTNSVRYVDINNMSCYARLVVTSTPDKKYEFCAAYFDLCSEGSDHNPGILEITFRNQSGNPTSVKKISFDIADPTGTDYTVIAHNSGTTISTKNSDYSFLFENCTDPFTKIEIKCTLNTNLNPDGNNLFELNNLVIYYEPSIRSQPSSVNVCAGDNTSITVDVSGTNPSYQWQKYNGSSWADLSGANIATLSFNPVTAGDAGDYHCIIGGDCSITITSSTATLAIKSNTSINTQPVSKIVCAGNDVSMTVEAGGTNLIYQWQKQSGSLWNDVPGATGSTLSFSPANTGDAGDYRCNVHGDCGPGITSDPVTLTVNANTSISAQPENTIACVGNNTSLAVGATGTNLSYRWQKSISSVWTDIPGATGATLSFIPANTGDAGNYHCVVHGDCGPDITSVAASLTVNTCLSVPQIVCVMDISGSMKRNFNGVYNQPQDYWRINYGKTALHAFAEIAYANGTAKYGLASFPGSGGYCSANENYSMNDLTAANYLNTTSGISITIDNLNPGGGTPLLAGLEKAKDMLLASGTSGKKAIVLLSDGAHNCPNQITNYTTDPVYVPLIQSMIDNNIKVFTLAFGNSGEVDIPLLQNIASQTSGGFYNVTFIEGKSTTGTPGEGVAASDWDPGLALAGAYSDILEDWLDFDYDEDPMGSIEKGTSQNYDIQVTPNDSKVTFFVNWVNDKVNNLKVRIITSNGTELPQNHPAIQYIHRNKYTIITVSEGFLNSSGVVGSTPWQLQINAADISGSSEKFQYIVMTKPDKFRFNTWSDKKWYYTGDIMKVYLELTYDGNRVKNLNSTYITGSRPLIGDGNLLAANRLTAVQLKEFSNSEIEQLTRISRQQAKDQKLDSVQTKTLIATNITEYNSEMSSPIMIRSRMLTAVNKIDLNKRIMINGMTFKDDGSSGDQIAGDGIFTAEYNKLRQEGSYKFNIGASGPVNGEIVSREDQLNTFVKVNTQLRYFVKHVSKSDTAMGGRKAFNIKLNLKDRYGNLPHPYSLKSVDLELSKGELVGPIMANPDGTYTQKIFLDENINPKDVTVSMNTDNRKGEDQLKNRFFLCYWICRKFCKAK